MDLCLLFGGDIVSDVSIVVGTFGSSLWHDLGVETLASLSSQTVKPKESFHIHSASLAEARNSGAELSTSKWLIFLDADDRLDDRYVEAMFENDDESTLRQPATLGVYPDGSEDDEAVLIPERPLIQSNFLVIGTMCLRQDFIDVGGFDPDLPVLEDWDLWLRIYKYRNAIIGKRPNAIYRIGVNQNSRNQNSSLHGRYYQRIRRKYAGV